jgi:drug/metabolite transporter (DMT)-like permease
MSNQTVQEYARGALCGLAAVSIWSGWIVAARFGLKTSLTPWDITAIRFSVAGLILLPCLLRNGLAIDRLGFPGLGAILLGGGAPMVLLANAGLMFAPAAHAGALFPGVMPLQVAILATFFVGESFLPLKRLGLLLIAGGALGIVLGTGGTIGSWQNLGQALFLASGLLWASYTIALKKARLDGLHAASIAAVGSLVAYVPVYAAVAGMPLVNAPWRDVAIQAVVQGLLTAIVSLMLYGRAVTLLGASSGAAFAALCPVLTAVLAIPVLGEWPTPTEWIALVLISMGVYFVSGGPLPATGHWRKGHTGDAKKLQAPGR